METRLREHQDACEIGMMEKLAVVEHVSEKHHPINWEETSVRGTTAEGGTAHTDDTCRGVLQQGQRTGNPGLLVYSSINYPH